MCKTSLYSSRVLTYRLDNVRYTSTASGSLKDPK